ncbi:hypothetical protein FE257_002390 [Aspergillus nanangensis]|uniref:GA4 desaturase family protein n=1 Tax=Aspergillus nanangensis TaxID=2582783 RepID=A0AAD4CCY5_ASPNN|nr:hypothetical protein FE257_002390 [Aspergillus nanangensis]
MPPQTIKTSLDYLHSSAFPSGRATVGTLEFCRIAPDRQPVEIEDVRERTEEFSLDVHGFQFLRHESPIFASFRDEDLSTVHQESVEFLQGSTGATSVHILTSLVRNQSHKELSKRIDSSEPDSSLVPLKTPSRRVHADQSEAGAYQVLKNSIAPDQVERVLQGHWAIINVWRPLKPVPCDPLAVADARSVPDEDLFPVHIQRPHKEPGNFYNTQSAGQGVEILFGQYGPGHKWYYMSDMTQYDIILIKVFDSKDDGKTARRTPHAAFIDPHTSEIQAARESLEMRCLLFPPE